MPRYLLDNNVVQYFVQTRRTEDLRTTAMKVEMAVSDVVKEEAGKGPFSKSAREALANFKVLPIVVGSSIDLTFNALEPPSSTKGKGERESIALALHEPDLIFVANDRNAMWIALRELHARCERMLGVPAFLRRMREDAGMSMDCIDAVMTRYLGREGKPPTWWAAWRGGNNLPV